MFEVAKAKENGFIIDNWDIIIVLFRSAIQCYSFNLAHTIYCKCLKGTFALVCQLSKLVDILENLRGKGLNYLKFCQQIEVKILLTWRKGCQNAGKSCQHHLWMVPYVVKEGGGGGGHLWNSMSIKRERVIYWKMATPTHPPCQLTSAFSHPTNPHFCWRNIWMPLM